MRHAKRCRPGTTSSCTRQGRIAVTHDSDAKERILKALIDRHDSAYRVQWDELGEEYREKMKRGIVGLTIDVERLEGKFKLSQNRPREDRARVQTEMLAGGPVAHALGNWMRGSVSASSRLSRKLLRGTIFALRCSLYTSVQVRSSPETRPARYVLLQLAEARRTGFGARSLQWLAACRPLSKCARIRRVAARAVAGLDRRHQSRGVRPANWPADPA